MATVSEPHLVFYSLPSIVCYLKGLARLKFIPSIESCFCFEHFFRDIVLLGSFLSEHALKPELFYPFDIQRLG